MRLQSIKANIIEFKTRMKLFNKLKVFAWPIKKKVICSRTYSFLCRKLGAKNCYVCPICNYYGFFLSEKPESGERKHSMCPKCGALERHRLQYLVFNKIVKEVDTKKMSILHFAPEDFFREIFSKIFKYYVTADLDGINVDRKEDLTKLSFADNSFDYIYASHVLEHIKDDLSALSEIRRVLKPNGCAIIPVLIINKKTIEYPEPNPHEHFHVRCPGQDYYEKYKMFFADVKLYSSADFDEKYQLYIYEDRTKWPATIPLRPYVSGVRHIDLVPVCFNKKYLQQEK